MFGAYVPTHLKMIVPLPWVKYFFFFVKFTFWFFKVHKKEKLSIISDGLELVNAWFIIILLTDILTIVGSVIKIYIDMKNLKVGCDNILTSSLWRKIKKSDTSKHHSYCFWNMNFFLQETYFYDVCSLCLGLSVLFIWIGILRYVGFLKKYNVS